jgi:hypothetical protein
MHFVLARLQHRDAVPAGGVGLELARCACREAHYEEGGARHGGAARIGDGALKARAYGLRMNEACDEHGRKADRKQATTVSVEHDRLRNRERSRANERVMMR